MIVVLPIGSDDANRINASRRVIAVWMPNTNLAGEGAWGGYRVSVDGVKKQIGYNLLSKVPESVQRVIEAEADKTMI